MKPCFKSMLTLCLASCAAWSGPSEAANQSCLLAVNKAGALTCKNEAGSRVLAEGFEIDWPMESTGVFDRPGRQFLQRSSYAADKDIVVVPVIHINRLPHYERILTFELDRFSEDIDGSQPYQGNEYLLDSPRSLEGFSWDNLTAEIGIEHRKIQSTGHEIELPDVAPPGAHTLTPVRLYGPHGESRGVRYYMDKRPHRFTPEKTICFSNCWKSNGKDEAL